MAPRIWCLCRVQGRTGIVLRARGNFFLIECLAANFDVICLILQAKAAALKMRGWDEDRLKEEHWKPHHDWAGREFYAMAVDLRGFYLKVQCNMRLLATLPAPLSVSNSSLLVSSTRHHPSVWLPAAGPVLCSARRVCARAHLQAALPATRSGVAPPAGYGLTNYTISRVNEATAL